MKINDIFVKDITRSIEGVIKAGDDSHVQTEVDEYVLTNEASKGLESLLEAYVTATSAKSQNGVWVSGFFGSGKSHMLKMLAHLLGDLPDSSVNRVQVINAFRNKAEGNAMLSGSIDRASRIPATSLLFNIDVKAALVSKDQPDAVLGVFIKVFDEFCGYSSLGHVAQFERHLATRGRLAKFHAAYADIAGASWELERDAPVLAEDFAAQAYAQVIGAQVVGENILDKYLQTYAPSIEDFTKNVKAWLDSQPAGTRLNFFVDEVGQFIAENTGLMLNLSSVTEELATRCDGRSWVLVTSQEDLDAVVGDRDASQGNDFSKIQARFTNKVKLNSSDVAEVIERRLLDKAASSTGTLKGIFDAEYNNFPTLFGFSDGGRKYRNYTDSEAFVASYPFVNYQYDLFQAAIVGLSEHNGFEGRHHAVGERSMLGVFQEVASALREREVGELASFDAMFEGIRKTLKAGVQQSILTAEEHLVDRPMAIRVLKALFLVKYVRDFKASARNLTVLLYGRFGQDISTLAADVQQSLDLLEQQTYIQRDGALYEYLTNDEKDIEQEIKSVDVDSSAVPAEIATMVSGEILKSRKFRYARNGQDFPFTLIVDGAPGPGARQELAVHIITPDNEFAGQQDVLVAHAAGKDELRVVLPSDVRFIPELLTYLKTRKYIKHNIGQRDNEAHTRILESKGRQNDQRRRDLSDRLCELIGKATLLTAGGAVPCAQTNATDRITFGFQELIVRTYPQLAMLGSRNYSDQDIDTAADASAMGSLNVSHSLPQPALEVASHISLREQQAQSVTLDSLVKHFSTKPYGWSDAAILTQIALLSAVDRVTLARDGAPLRRTQIAGALRQPGHRASMRVESLAQHSPAQVRAIRDFHKEYFPGEATPAGALETAKACKDGFVELTTNLLPLVASVGRYPMVAPLGSIVIKLQQLATKLDKELVTDLPIQADDLLDERERVIAPIQGFFAGPQRGIYDDAAKRLAIAEANVADLSGETVAKVHRALADPDLLTSGRMAALKIASDKLQAELDALLTTSRANAQGAVNKRATQLRTLPEWASASDSSRSAVEQAIEQVLSRIGVETNAAAIRGASITFADITYPTLIDRLTPPIPTPPPLPSSSGDKPTRPTPPHPPARPTVALRSLPVGHSGELIRTEAEATAYTDALRAAIVTAIHSGKQVSL